jgi:phytanoyl-CoA hydroxylase
MENITQAMLAGFKENGYLHLPGFLEKNLIDEVLVQSKQIFIHQFKQKKYINHANLNEISPFDFDQLMYRLFDDDVQTLANCGKQIQHLISLHRLSLHPKLISLLKDIGMTFPNISTRPVLFFNHPKLAKEKVFYKVDAHQDWRSMQGSLNSVVIWLPLIDVSKDLGALEILPKSHLLGLITNNIDHGFGMVKLTEEQKNELLTVEVKVGDILIFNSFLIHQSGENISSTPRWSCHFRYNDLAEPTFIERGYPHAYLYKPVDTLITPDFPKPTHIIKAFHE